MTGMAELTGRTARLLRALALGGTTLALAVGAHTGAGGALPPPALLTLLVLFVAPPSLWLAGRRRAVGRTVTALVVEQAGLHGAFTLLAVAPAGCGATVAAAGHHAVHVSGSTCGMAAMPASHGMSSISMLLAHAAATVVTAVILVRGESALRAVLRYAAQWRVPRLPGDPAVLDARTVLFPPAPAPLWSALREGGPPPRGPPAGSFAPAT
jgi:hypothetical protein